MKKIDELINKRAMETGKMGFEPVTVHVKLTDAEVDEFFNSEKYFTPHYSWWFFERVLEITYVEDILDDELMRFLEMYMDGDIMEKVHYELVPCTNEAFMRRYLELDPDFENVYREIVAL